MSDAFHEEPSANFHPYECEHEGKCIHCDRERLFDHDPSTCALCDPAYDRMPNPWWNKEDGAGSLSASKQKTAIRREGE